MPLPPPSQLPPPQLPIDDHRSGILRLSSQVPNDANHRYDRLLEAALALLGDIYFDLVHDQLGPRYAQMRTSWQAAGGAAYTGGAPSVYLGIGSTTTLHVDDMDYPLGGNVVSGSATVFARFDVDPAANSDGSIAAQLLRSLM